MDCSCDLVICTACQPELVVPKPKLVVPVGPTTPEAAEAGDTWAGYTWAEVDRLMERAEAFCAERIQQVWEATPGKDPYSVEPDIDYRFKMRLEFQVMSSAHLAGFPSSRSCAPPFIMPAFVEPKGRW
ncbi:MAG: hypothetical protein ABW167_05250 [Baekduia sp.]